MAEINVNARQLLDEKGELYFPFTHVNCVEGLPDNFNDFDIGNVQEDVNSLKAQLKSIQDGIVNMPTVTDTGWQNITFLNGTTAYDKSTTPRARLFSVNGVYFLSLKGAFKGLTSNNVEIGKLPSSMVFAIKENKFFAQTTNIINNSAQFTRMRLDINGTIKLEGATLSTITSGMNFAIDITIIL